MQSACMLASSVVATVIYQRPSNIIVLRLDCNVLDHSTSFISQKVLGFRQANLPKILKIRGKALSTDCNYRSITYLVNDKISMRM